MRLLSLFLTLFLFTYFANAQHCGTDIREAEKKLNPAYRKSQEKLNRLINQAAENLKNSRIAGEEPVFTIPVVVHIIHNSRRIGGLNNTNISDDQILSQIQVINEDFRRRPGTNGFNNHPAGADTRIEFCLATRDPDGNPTTGIVRKYFEKLTWSRVQDERFMKSLSYWPSDQYLNIWVADLADDSHGTLLGYGTYPSNPDSLIEGMGNYVLDEKIEGVVIDYYNFGKVSGLRKNYELGRTTTHEIGHFLGLYHLWGEDDTGCGNDFVEDTPQDAGPNVTRTCTDYSVCPSTNGSSRDMSNNYLDYSYDQCMNIFTVGQKYRMRAALTHVPTRKSLLNSPGCCGSGTLAPHPVSEDFESGEWQVYNPGFNNFSRTETTGSNSNVAFCFSPRGTLNGDTVSRKHFGFIVSPYIYFKNTSNPLLAFDLAYAAAEVDISTDSLVVSVQANCGSWIPAGTYTGSNLVTTGKKTSGFRATESDWKTFNISLPELAGKTVGRIRFEFYSKKGSNLYLDNINVYETSREITITPYPNPASDLMNLKILFEGNKDLNIQIFSSQGAIVWEQSVTNTLSMTMPVNISDLGAGVYFVKVTSGNEKSVTSFLKSH